MASFLAGRLRVPSLVLFLGIGMLGSDAIGYVARRQVLRSRPCRVCGYDPPLGARGISGPDRQDARAATQDARAATEDPGTTAKRPGPESSASLTASGTRASRRVDRQRYQVLGLEVVRGATRRTRAPGSGPRAAPARTPAPFRGSLAAGYLISTTLLVQRTIRTTWPWRVILADPWPVAGPG
jgi:hypothetical protein